LAGFLVWAMYVDLVVFGDFVVIADPELQLFRAKKQRPGDFV